MLQRRKDIPELLHKQVHIFSFCTCFSCKDKFRLDTNKHNGQYFSHLLKLFLISRHVNLATFNGPNNPQEGTCVLLCGTKKMGREMIYADILIKIHGSLFNAMYFTSSTEKLTYKYFQLNMLNEIYHNIFPQIIQ